MVVYDVISLICTAIMLSIVLTIAVKLIIFKRPDRINYIRNFKKGKCAIIYLVAVPLYCMSNMYCGKNFVDAIFDAISKSIYLIALKYDTSNVAQLAAVSPIFKATTYLCFTLVILNALMFAFSLFHQGLWEFVQYIKFRSGKNNKCIILGNNSTNKTIYKTCNCKKIVVANFTNKEQEKLYISNISYKAFIKGKSFTSWLYDEVEYLIKKLSSTKSKVNVIINEEDEKHNLYLCGQFVDFIGKHDDSIVNYIDVYVFGNREFEDIYSEYEKSSKGCLHYVNEYRQIAIDFIDRFPLTRFMNEDHVDYGTSLLKDGVEIGVSMIGFGRTNQQIFLSMVANNQYLTKNVDGKIVEKPVTYHLFDKLHTGGHKNLNHNYFRYKHDFFKENELKVNKDDYLPLPSMPSEDVYHYFDVNDIDFYDDLKNVINTKQTSLNYVIVSLGVDYASIDMANKIVVKLQEWKIKNCHVFVRVRDKEILKDAHVFLDTTICHPFGTEDEVVYEYEHIIQERFTEMAIKRNYVYDIEHDMKHDTVTAAEMDKSRLKWFTKKSALERESNLYACLSLQNKLHLMGLEYLPKTVEEQLFDLRQEKAIKDQMIIEKNQKVAQDEIKLLDKEIKRLEKLIGDKGYVAKESPKGLTEKEFLEHYAKDDMPDVICTDGGRAVRYSIDFMPSLRQNMAIQEHSRWNAYMIMQGFIPATKHAILTEKNDGVYTNGKSYEMRHHGNLTTYEGLVDFRKMVASRDGKSEHECDVIKYDYQLLDGAYWLLDKSGYKICKR